MEETVQDTPSEAVVEEAAATPQEALKKEVIAAICEIYDPEIPVNIYELGLIYDVHVAKA
jgi:metal-sulfur cluster biosynthetic enzyme